MSGFDTALDVQLDQATVDRDYFARGSVSDDAFASATARYATGTAAAQVFATALDQPYDLGSGERIDIYGTVPGQLRPVILFIHGGYWRALGRKDSGFMAPALAEAGIATAVPDYTLAPAVNLTEIVRQMRAALAWLWTNAARQGIDRNRIIVSGSSAGGHLAGTLLSGGWQAAMGLPETPVAAALPISGLFDLAPIARTYPDAWMQFTEDEIALLSPLRQLPARGCPICLALGANEAAGFARQSAAYDTAWRAAGFSSEVFAVPGRHHFDVVLDLADPSTALFGKLVALVESTADQPGRITS
ncbi:alpha/beta hydrolase [Antarcticimicrobium sediminis]|uniref:alpha/beta hydrolase n=1 Tax=Antarcticimicrobium sediminis TaxID=2546227 RepID=UPI0019CF64F6|nr:alpha/beta hydrolase [Antarcticimicrobium sediminis]